MAEPLHNSMDVPDNGSETASASTRMPRSVDLSSLFALDAPNGLDSDDGPPLHQSLRHPTTEDEEESNDIVSAIDRELHRQLLLSEEYSNAIQATWRKDLRRQVQLVRVASSPTTIRDTMLTTLPFKLCRITLIVT